MSMTRRSPARGLRHRRPSAARPCSSAPRSAPDCRCRTESPSPPTSSMRWRREARLPAAAFLSLAEQLDGPLAVRSSAVGEDFGRSELRRPARDEAQHPWPRSGARCAVSRSGSQAAPRIGARLSPAHRMRTRSRRWRVVVQRLVHSDVAGVLFTCNPVTGHDEIVIEAAWGLGESVVQGMVIPDRIRMTRAGAVLERQAGLEGHRRAQVTRWRHLCTRRFRRRSHAASASATRSCARCTDWPAIATRPSARSRMTSNGPFQDKPGLPAAAAADHPHGTRPVPDSVRQRPAQGAGRTPSITSRDRSRPSCAAAVAR